MEKRIHNICKADVAHAVRVSLIAGHLADNMGLDYDLVGRVEIAGLLHDIGKKDVPMDILLHPGRLDEGQRREMERHAIFGVVAIEKDYFPLGHPYKRTCREVCAMHHERLDGTGYPVGLRGDQIPLPARIVAVADVFDALTSDRPYRAGMDPDQAWNIVSRREPGLDRLVISALERDLDFVVKHIVQSRPPDLGTVQRILEGVITKSRTDNPAGKIPKANKKDDARAA